MHSQPLRGLIGLTAVAAATAVGLTTRSAGFTALTFVGALVVPHLLGFGGRHHGHGCAGHGEHGPGGRHRQMRGHLEERLDAWHAQAHGESPGDAPAPGTAAPA